MIYMTDFWLSGYKYPNYNVTMTRETAVSIDIEQESIENVKH